MQIKAETFPRELNLRRISHGYSQSRIVPLNNEINKAHWDQLGWETSLLCQLCYSVCIDCLVQNGFLLPFFKGTTPKRKSPSEAGETGWSRERLQKSGEETREVNLRSMFVQQVAVFTCARMLQINGQSGAIWPIIIQIWWWIFILIQMNYFNEATSWEQCRLKANDLCKLCIL